jgi:hypothetical protein
MSTTKFYDELISCMPAGLEHEVLSVLNQHVGKENRIAFRSLVIQVMGKFNSTTERQVREAIERLRKEQTIPVMSESGRGGRWLAASQDEIDANLTEWRARRRNLDEVIQALETSRTRIAPHQFGQQVLF